MPLASLIGYAWGGSLGYDIAQAALSELLNEPRSRQLLDCGEPGLGGTTGPCERARWAVLRRLVSTRAREGDATSAAVGRRLPVEALAALAEAALTEMQAALARPYLSQEEVDSLLQKHGAEDCVTDALHAARQDLSERRDVPSVRAHTVEAWRMGCAA